VKTSKKVLMTLVVVGVAGSIIASAVFSAFSATTSNPGNQFQAGTVSISDNDAGAAMYNILAAAPGATTSKCIKVTFDGNLPSTVKLYTAAGTTGLPASSQYLNLTITPGTQASPSFPSCTGFTPDAGGAIYTGTINDWRTSHNAWSNGLAVNDQTGNAVWDQNDAVVYKFDVQVQNVPAAQGADSGIHDFTWESQNN
jgi:predicted ribosomally synthesized peptide with SipW-like signal peptide